MERKRTIQQEGTRAGGHESQREPKHKRLKEELLWTYPGHDWRYQTEKAHSSKMSGIAKHSHLSTSSTNPSEDWAFCCNDSNQFKKTPKPNLGTKGLGGCCIRDLLPSMPDELFSTYVPRRRSCGNDETKRSWRNRDELHEKPPHEFQGVQAMG